MFSVIACGILLLIAFAFFVFGPRVQLDSYTRDDEGNKVRDTVSLRLAGLIPLLIVLVWLASTCTTIVQAKQVGVVTTFGKPSDTTLGSGLHLKAPWQKVTDIDATIQTDEYHGDSAIKVILSDKNTADISATIRWAINKDKANEIYADFRSDDPTDSFRKAVVSTQFKAAMNSVFNSYDATAESPLTPSELSDKVHAILKEKTHDLLDIKSITISYIKPDKAVQKKIDALQTQRGATKVAEEKIVTAKAEAEANRILSESVSNDPNVLVSKCLDLIADGAFEPPAGFSCWPGSTGSVVVPSAK